jgi:hypothetical protein
MIQPLRLSHLRIWVVLSIFLFALFVAGLIVRRPATPENRNLHWEQFP